MVGFPRTNVGQVIGTNWFLGYTHSTYGQSQAMKRIVTNRDAIADIIEVFLNEGVDTIMCPHTTTCMFEAIQEAEGQIDVVDGSP